MYVASLLGLVMLILFTLTPGNYECYARAISAQIILLTDGGSNIRAENTIPNADDLKRSGAEIHVIAIGDQVDMREINGIASEVSEPFVYRVSNQGEARDAAQRLCDALCQ